MTAGADGVRLPPATRPGCVRLQVADLARSLEWYGRVLGVETGEEQAGRAILTPPGGSTPLVELHERPGAVPAPPRGRLGLFHYAILLPTRPDLGRFAKHLADLGEPVGASDHLVSEALYLRDPDGLGVEVYADRPRSAWQYEEAQLVMATEPLDLEDLVRAGGGVRWTALPSGALVGHVHLRVGDLEQAEDFYHRTLGLDRTVWNYPGALFLSAGGYHHHLGVNTWARGAAPPDEEEARLLEWELLVPAAADARDVAKRADRAGYQARMTEDGAVLRDPWGTPLRLCGRSGHGGHGGPGSTSGSGEGLA